MRWNSTGQKLATTSNGGSARVVDFATEKVLYTEFTSDRSKVYFLMINITLIS